MSAPSTRDPELTKRLNELARTIVEQLLGRRTNSQPGTELYYPTGTRQFSLLHQHTSPAELVLLLDQAARELTKNVWRVSTCDSAIYSATDESVLVVLHRNDVYVASMDEVPDDVLIFGLRRGGDYGVRQLRPYTPRAIAQNRAKLATGVVQLRTDWRRDRAKLVARLYDSARTELANQTSLNTWVSGEIRRLLASCAVDFGRTEALNSVLQVLHYLGVLDRYITSEPIGAGEPAQEA